MTYPRESILYSDSPYEEFRLLYDEVDVFLNLYPHIDFGISTCSPLRNDNTPSWIIGDKYGYISYKDFATGEGGNLFSFVKRYEGLTSNFAALEFLLEHYENAQRGSEEAQIEIVPTRKVRRNTNINLGVKYRRWNSDDKAFWNSIPLSKKTLEKYNVRPIKMVFVNDYSFPAEKLAYAYHEYKDGIMTLEIYQPESEKHKWMTTHDSSVWQGWEQMKLKSRSNTLIITKSRKDVMFFFEHSKYASTSFQAEGVLPKKHVIEERIKGFKRVILLYDNDIAGVEYSYRFMELIGNQLGIEQKFLPAELGKDITDISKNHGLQIAKQIIKNL